MTLTPRWWPRPGLLRDIPTKVRTFEVAPGSKIVAKCQWQPSPPLHSTLLLVHGLEGCTESHYMKGIAHKAWYRGFNVIRMNQRNCGGTEHLTPTLYNGGMSGDLRAVVSELVHHDGLSAIWLAGYSMGGNLVLKLSGEVGASLPELKGTIAVCPNIHPAECVKALQQPNNWIYYNFFLWNLKGRLQRKARLFPHKWDLSGLHHIRTLREFDDAFTSNRRWISWMPLTIMNAVGHGMSSERSVSQLLIITAQDDPFIPFHIFGEPAIQSNPAIQLLAPRYGGHCGFLQKPQPHEDLYWAENRIIDFVKS